MKVLCPMSHEEAFSCVVVEFITENNLPYQLVRLSFSQPVENLALKLLGETSVVKVLGSLSYVGEFNATLLQDYLQQHDLPPLTWEEEQEIIASMVHKPKYKAYKDLLPVLHQLLTSRHPLFLVDWVYQNLVRCLKNERIGQRQYVVVVSLKNKKEHALVKVFDGVVIQIEDSYSELSYDYKVPLSQLRSVLEKELKGGSYVQDVCCLSACDAVQFFE